MVLTSKPVSHAFAVHHTSFGAADRPPCSHCGHRTGINRREPHPILGLEYELQTFVCSCCARTYSRTAERDSSTPLQQTG
jgi:hypothetical protein